MTRASPNTSPYTIAREVVGSGMDALVHPRWTELFPWLIQGTTTRASGGDHPFDLGLFADASDPESARLRWRMLREGVGVDRIVHAHQLHGAEVRVYERDGEGAEDPHLVEACDGHATATPGVLLAVTTADCVPVFVVDTARRAVAAVHAGWRGAATGVLEHGLEAMASGFASRVEDLHVHMGPAICGACYEVGPEVFEALDQDVPDRPTPIDLRRILAQRAARAGVRESAITVSAHCTVCTESGLFSHRAGHGERQAGYIGIRG